MDDNAGPAALEDAVCRKRAGHLPQNPTLALERRVAYSIFFVAFTFETAAQAVRHFRILPDISSNFFTAIAGILLLATSYYLVRLISPMRGVRRMMLVGVGFIFVWSLLDAAGRTEPTAHWFIIEKEGLVRPLVAMVCNLGAFMCLVMGFFMSLLYAREANVLLQDERQDLIREMADRARAEEALRASESRFRNLFNASPIAIVDTDCTGLKDRFEELRDAGITDLNDYFDKHPEEALNLCTLVSLRDFNDAFLRMADAGNSEEIRTDFITYFEEETFAAIRSAFADLFNGETQLSYELPVRDSKRTSKWLMIKMLLQPGHEETFDSLLISVLDMTNQKQSEEALRQSERRFRGYFELPLIGIAVSSPQKKWVHVNDKLCELLGYPREDLMMMRWSDTTHPDDIEQNLVLFNRVVAGLEEGFRLEKRFVRKDGSIVWVDLAARCLRKPDRSIDAFLTVMQDITARREAETERFALERQIQQSQRLESLGVLAGGIAHDFNNILMAILGYADMAQSELPPESGARASLAEIETASRRAADLCRQMLAYSGRGKFVVEPMDLRLLIEDMSHLLKTSVSKKATLLFNFADEQTCLHGDMTQIRQVVMNLVVNASEALGEESGSIAVSTSMSDCTREHLDGAILGANRDPGKFVCLEVSDTGCGMSPVTLQRVFEPFFTTKFTGRGLGMAAVLGIVRGHNGALSVDSVEGKGTTFRIFFPALEAAMLPATPISAAAVKSGSAAGRILLVDDEESIRTLSKKMLERLGFSVVTAKDGAEAVQQFLLDPAAVDAVVLDLTMPRMNGEEALRELRSIEPGVRVVISSGYTEYEISKRFADNAPAGFIQKPYDSATLEAQLRNVLALPTA